MRSIDCCVKVREVFVNENAWLPPGAYPIPPMDPSSMKIGSEWINSRYWDEAIPTDQAVYDRINAAYGTDFEQRRTDRRQQ